MTYRTKNVILLLIIFTSIFLSANGAPDAPEEKQPPNILFAYADDWGVHASAYGTEVVETPNFDRLAEQGMLFDHAFVSTPSCTESRGAVLTGEHTWRLGSGSVHHSVLPKKHKLFPQILKRKKNYFLGKHGKVGAHQKGVRNPSGQNFSGMKEFLNEVPEDRPFFFWLGEGNIHRHFDKNAGKKMEINPENVVVPPYLPDVPTVRQDIANYYGEVKKYDRLLGTVFQQLKKAGEWENTIIVLTSDHGWSFPRGKANLYDAGTRVPMAIAGPGVKRMEEKVTDFVNILDLAPTLLEAAGITPPDRMSGRSFLDLLRDGPGDGTNTISGDRSHVLLAFERHHGYGRMPGTKTYPVRAIRTDKFLYVRNYRPDRWPAGSPYISSSQGIFGDVDDAVTKNWMIKHANDPEIRDTFRLCFGKRPAEELYFLPDDPHQVNNVANKKKYQSMKSKLSRVLTRKLKALDDPRETDAEVKFNDYKYRVGYGWERVEPPEQVKKALDLDE